MSANYMPKFAFKQLQLTLTCKTAHSLLVMILHVTLTCYATFTLRTSAHKSATRFAKT